MTRKSAPCLCTRLRVVYLRRAIAACRKILSVRGKPHAAHNADPQRPISTPYFALNMPSWKTYLSCWSVCTKLTSSTRFTFGLKTANQSLPSFFSSGGMLGKSTSSKYEGASAGEVDSTAPATAAGPGPGGGGKVDEDGTSAALEGPASGIL